MKDIGYCISKSDYPRNWINTDAEMCAGAEIKIVYRIEIFKSKFWSKNVLTK